MDLLIIGGTKFVGPAIVDVALERDHRVTLFNRGRTAAAARPGVETIIGDRETDLDRLAARRWDAVIDTCGYLPRVVRLSVVALRGSVNHYTFISTLSVYPPSGTPNRDESSAVLSMADTSVEEVKGETYGPLKALCEVAVWESFPDSCLIIRSGLIVGPQDPTNRFTYWVTRSAKGGDAIAPPKEQPVQFIDVRDLAEFVVRQTETRREGVFNVTGPAARMTFGELLPIATASLGSDVQYHHVSDDFLREQQVGEFMELPLWVNGVLAESFMTFNIDKALDAGLLFQPLAQTIRDTYNWSLSQSPETSKPADLPELKEAALLRNWKDDCRR